MSKEISIKLTKLNAAIQAASEKKDENDHCWFFHGPTNEELDAEHELEYRLFTEQVDYEKRAGLLHFLIELGNNDHQIEPWEDQLTCISSELFQLYTNWCDLDDTPMLTEELFFHGLYLFGFVSRDCFIGIEMTDGIEIDLSTDEVRLNLKANPHAEL
jgi:hypothetical protein